MWVSELWIYWETRGSLRDNLALERRAVAPAHCNVNLILISRRTISVEGLVYKLPKGASQ